MGRSRCKVVMLPSAVRKSLGFPSLPLIGIVSAICFASPVPVYSQDKWFSTPGRGGAEGAKTQAIIHVLLDQHQRMNSCTSQGRIYAPTNLNRDAQDCIPILDGTNDCNPATILCVASNISVPALPHGRAITYLAPGTVDNRCLVQCWNGTFYSSISGN